MGDDEETEPSLIERLAAVGLDSRTLEVAAVCEDALSFELRMSGDIQEVAFKASLLAHAVHRQPPSTAPPVRDERPGLTVAQRLADHNAPDWLVARARKYGGDREAAWQATENVVLLGYLAFNLGVDYAKIENAWRRVRELKRPENLLPSCAPSTPEAAETRQQQAWEAHQRGEPLDLERIFSESVHDDLGLSFQERLFYTTFGSIGPDDPVGADVFRRAVGPVDFGDW